MDLGCHDIGILSLTIRLTDTLGYIRLILIYFYISGCTLTMLYVRYFVLYEQMTETYLWKEAVPLPFVFQQKVWLYSLVIKNFLLVTQSH